MKEKLKIIGAIILAIIFFIVMLGLYQFLPINYITGANSIQIED